MECLLEEEEEEEEEEESWLEWMSTPDLDCISRKKLLLSQYECM